VYFLLPCVIVCVAATEMDCNQSTANLTGEYCISQCLPFVIVYVPATGIDNDKSADLAGEYCNVTMPTVGYCLCSCY
jgi:hypothetical protein